MTGIPDLSPLSASDREVVGKALSKKPEDRYRSCADLLLALKSESSTEGRRGDRPVGGLGPAITDTPSLAKFTTEREHHAAKALPALVTQRSKVRPTGIPQSGSKPGLDKPSNERAAAPVELIGDGVLFPALLVGIGGVGIAAMRAFRQLILDRFGRPTLPNLRWLVVDTDPESAAAALAGPMQTAFAPDEVLLTRLERPSHYLSREGLPPVETWLPPEELYRMPRTPATDGVRGIGRLALCDHYQTACERIRSALEPFLSMNCVDDADCLTHLGIRSNFPRVYVATSLTGGTGSGMFLDLTYLIRRELRRLGFRALRVIGLLGIPGEESERLGGLPLANTNAALTELEHFGRPGSPYKAHFDTREKRFEDTGRAFRRCTVLRLANTLDQSEFNRAAARFAHVAFAEVLCPMGRTIYPDDDEPPENPLAAVGIQRIVWPRTQVLRAAGWLLSRRLVLSWSAKANGPTRAITPDFIESQWQDRHLDRMTLQAAIESHLTVALGGAPLDRIQRALRPFSEEGDAETTWASRTKKVFKQLVELVGRPGPDERECMHAVGKALLARSRELSAQADAKVNALSLALVEQPGLRLNGADDAVRQLRDRIAQELTLADREAAAIEEQTQNLYIAVQHQLVDLSSDHSPRGGRSTVSASDPSAPFRQWAASRYQGLVAKTCANVYRILLGNLPEHVRELNRIREQLATFVKHLDAAVPNASLIDGVCRPVLPDGAANVAEVVGRITGAIGPDEFRDFENEVQARIRHEFHGLVGVCSRPKDLGPALLSLLNEQAVRFLESRVPRSKASEILATQCNGTDDLQAQATEFLDMANPRGFGPLPDIETYLGLPDETGPFSKQVRNLCRGELVRLTNGTADFVVWRESRGLTVNSFTHLMEDRSSFSGTSARPSRPAHSRTDIVWTVSVEG